MGILSTSPGKAGGASVLKIARESAQYFGADIKASLSVPSFSHNFDTDTGSLSNEELAAFDGVNVVAEHAQGIEVDTPRYRELTVLLSKMAQANGDFVEIAGNDDILFTVTSDSANLDEALYSFARQGYGDFRHLILLPVADLADTLRSLDGQSLHLEHIHDF